MCGGGGGGFLSNPFGAISDGVSHIGQVIAGDPILSTGAKFAAGLTGGPLAAGAVSAGLSRAEGNDYGTALTQGATTAAVSFGAQQAIGAFGGPEGAGDVPAPDVYPPGDVPAPDVYPPGGSDLTNGAGDSSPTTDGTDTANGAGDGPSPGDGSDYGAGAAAAGAAAAGAAAGDGMFPWGDVLKGAALSTLGASAIGPLLATLMTPKAQSATPTAYTPPVNLDAGGLLAGKPGLGNATGGTSGSMAGVANTLLTTRAGYGTGTLG